MHRFDRQVARLTAGGVAVACMAIAAMACGGGGGAGSPAPQEPVIPAPYDSTLLRETRACTGADASGWCWQHPSPYALHVGAVKFVDPAFGWGLGGVNTLVTSADGGATWHRRDLPFASVQELVFTDRSNGWLTGPGVIARTRDGGLNWAAAASLPASPSGCCLVVGPNGIVAVPMADSASRSLLTKDDGASWQQVLRVFSARGVAGWLVHESSLDALVETVDTPFPAAPWHNKLWPLASGTSWVLPDDGSAWALFNEYRAAAVAQAAREQPQILVRPAPSRQHVYRSVDRGRSWESWPITFTGSSNATWLTRWTIGGDGSGMAYGTNSPIEVGNPNIDQTLHTTVDGGRTWSPIALPPGSAASAAAPPLGYLLDARSVGARVDDKLQLSFDAGKTWQAVTSLPGTQLQGVQREADGSLSAYPTLGNTFRSYRSSDNGASWKALPYVAGVDGDIKGLAIAAGGRGWAMTYANRVYLTEDDGANWSRAGTLPVRGSEPRAAGVAADGTGWAHWDYQELLLTADQGRSWQAVALPAEVTTIAAADVASRQQMRLLARTCTQQTELVCDWSLVLTDDGGTRWQSRLLPAEVISAIGYARMVWRGSERAWLVTGRGAWRTLDAGRTWQAGIAPATDGTAPIALRMLSDDVGLGLTSAGLMRTVDGGRQWSAVALPASWPQFPADLAFADTRSGWLVGSNGTVLISQDGGATWAAQARATNYGLSALFVRDANQAWAAGAGMTILATRNGGR